MNDLDKLSEIIADLENQAGHIRDFNGVLSAVNEARREIESSQTTILAVTEDQKRLVADTNNNFVVFYNGIRDIQKQLTSLKKSQDNLQQIISDLKFLTPEIFYQSQQEIISLVNVRFTQLTEEMERETSDLQSSLDSLSSSVKSMRSLIIIGFIVMIIVTGAAFVLMKFI